MAIDWVAWAREQEEKKHAYIGEAEDHARGYYMGMSKALCYVMGQATGASQRDKDGGYVIEIPLDDAGYGYSRSGTQKHAASFYSPEPAAANDLVRHSFDPLLMYCMLDELDSEGGFLAYRFKLVPWDEGRALDGGAYMQIKLWCTEDDIGVPDDLPEQSWEDLEKMRDLIKGLDGRVG